MRDLASGQPACDARTFKQTFSTKADPGYNHKNVTKNPTVLLRFVFDVVADEYIHHHESAA